MAPFKLTQMAPAPAFEEADVHIPVEAKSNPQNSVWCKRFANHSIGSLPSTSGCPGVASAFFTDSQVFDDEPLKGCDESSDSGLSDSESEVGECKKEDQQRTGWVSLAAFGRLPDTISCRRQECVYAESQTDATDVGDHDSMASMARLSDVDDEDRIVFGFVPQSAPLLDVDDDSWRPGSSPTCPPKAWLRLAGFEVGRGPAFASVPRPVVAGEAPTRYLDLFGRQVLERQRTSSLTVAALKEHDRKLGKVRHCDPVPGDIGMSPATSTWLFHFLAQARATPLYEVAATLLGSDLCEHIAGCLDQLSDTSSTPARIDEKDAPDGRRVTGRRVLVRPVARGSGRRGFEIRDDVSISTAGGRSLSPAPRRQTPPAHLDASPPRPPLL